MRLSADRWLTDVLGFDVFRVNDAASMSAEELDAVGGHFKDRSKALYYTKVDTCAVEAVGMLARLGFTVVDVNMTFAAPPAAIVAAVASGGAIDVAFAEDSQRAPVLDIAGSCFRYSRFHLDPLLTQGAAHHVKREWVASYFEGRRGDRLFVARVAGRIAGFLAAVMTEHAGRPAAAIDLVGVAADHQRAGVGRALARQFAAHYADCERVIVGTQAANVPSIRMYEGLGFRAVRSAYVLHRHVDSART